MFQLLPKVEQNCCMCTLWSLYVEREDAFRTIDGTINNYGRGGDRTHHSRVLDKRQIRKTTTITQELNLKGTCGIS
jgi:hypothetical protein